MTEIDQGTATLILVGIQRRYNLARENLYKRTQMYFNQSIGSNYILESQLRDLIDECESIKQEYKEFQTSINSQKKRIV